MKRHLLFPVTGLSLVVVALAGLAGSARATGPFPTATSTASVNTSAKTVPFAPKIIPGTPVPVQTSGAHPIPVTENPPFEHTFANNGSHFIVAATRANWMTMYGLSGIGNLWTTGVTIPTPQLSCGAVAIDAGQPNVFYVVHYGGRLVGNGNSGTMLRLDVSLDGGVTYSKTYELIDSTGSYASLNCPDVISPQPGTVIVSAIAPKLSNNTGQSGSYAATWVGTNNGASFGALASATGSNPTTSVQDTNSGSFQGGCWMASNNNFNGPRLSTNGAGTVCLTYVEGSGCSGDGAAHYVQCSTDAGAHWSPRYQIATGVDRDLFAAVSPSGKNVALTWMKQLGTSNGVVIAYSQNSGASFFVREYPPTLSNAVVPNSAPSRPVIAWESDSALWLAQSLTQYNTRFMIVDRTQDLGHSWMGAVSVGNYIGTSLLNTGNGAMVVAGFPSGGSSSVLIPLSIQLF